MSEGNSVDRMLQRIGDGATRHAVLLRDPESMIGLFIVTLWATLAAVNGGWLVVVIVLTIAWAAHAVAVESGNHVLLWLSTAMVLVLIIVAAESTFGGLPPVLLAAAGATALAYNELVRLNYTRRRNAVVHADVFNASALGVGGAALLGVVGVTVATVADDGSERSWLWVPIAVGALMLIGFVLTIAPARRTSKASKERWQPGDRIPPQPLANEDIGQF